MSKELASALRDTLISPNVADSNWEPANLVDVLDAIARAIRFSAKHLGTGDAVTQMGALGNLAKEVKEGSERVAGGLHAIAEAINRSDSVRP